MKVDLSDSYTKLDRARYHIADIQAQIARFLATDFYTLTTKTDKATGQLKVHLQSLHEPDKRLNATIGDAIGNLRSTLDYAAVTLVSPITNKSSGIGFPFADNESGFKGEVGKAALSVCAQAIQDHFVNEVQAYERGKGHTLWVLNKLRNIDKHRLLVATTEAAGVRFSFVEPRSNGRFDGANCMIKAGSNGCLLDIPVTAQLTKEPTPTFEVRLHEPPFLEHTPVSAFLQSAASDIKRLLDALKVL